MLFIHYTIENSPKCDQTQLSVDLQLTWQDLQESGSSGSPSFSWQMCLLQPMVRQDFKSIYKRSTDYISRSCKNNIISNKYVYKLIKF